MYFNFNVREDDLLFNFIYSLGLELRDFIFWMLVCDDNNNIMRCKVGL